MAAPGEPISWAWNSEATMTRLREQLSLDYLKRSREPEVRPSPHLQEAIQGVVIAYGGEMLGILSKAPDNRDKLYHLIEEIGIPIEEALEVTEFFEKNGYVDVISRDLKGNHELKLTDRGLKLIKARK